jgi:DNA-binding beta-propeller fold protein YncE
VLAALVLLAAGATRALAQPCAGSAGASCPYASVAIIGQRAEGVLRFPEAVALDGHGNLYVADQLSYVVEEFSSSGAFETQWGSYGSGPGQFGPIGGLATDAQGNVYVVDSEHNRIEKFTSNGAFITSWGHTGSGLGQFHFFSSKDPSRPPGGGIAVAGNYVYVADSGNDRVERFNLEGGEPLEWGSKGSEPGQFNYPRGVAANAGEVIVSDDDNRRVEKFGPNGEFQSAAGSPGTGPGQFAYPYGVSLDAAGNVYVADDSNDRIVKLNPELGFISDYASQGAKPGQLSFPRALASEPDGETYVADTANNRVNVYDANGNYLRTIGLSGRGPGAMTAPAGLATDPTGRLLVSDTVGNRIELFGPPAALPGGPAPAPGASAYLGSWEAAGPKERRFSAPAAIAVDGRGSVYVAEPASGRIARLWGEGTFLSELGGPSTIGGEELSEPGGVAAGGTGYVYVADTAHNRILVYPPEGSPLVAPGRLRFSWGAGGGSGAAGSGPGEFDHPDALAVNADGDVYVADTGNDRIVRLSPTGTVLGEWGGAGAAPGRFNSPSGIAVDGAGDLYVVDSANNRIQVFTADGRFLSQWGTRGIGPGEFSEPTAIAIDCLGDIYVADTDNNRVERFDPVSPNPAPGGCQSSPAWPPPLDVPPVLQVGLMHSAGILAHRAVALTVRCQRPCRVRVTGTLATRGRRRAAVALISVSRSLPASATGHVRLRLRAGLLARLQRQLRHKRGLIATIRVLAVGPTGRRTTVAERYLLTR